MFCSLLLFPPIWIQTNRSAYLIFIPVASLRNPPGIRFMNCNSALHILLPSLYFSRFLVFRYFCFFFFHRLILRPTASHQPAVRTTNFYVKQHFYAQYVTSLLLAGIPIRCNIRHLEQNEEKLTDSHSQRNEHDRKLCPFQCSAQHFHWNRQQTMVSPFTP